VGLPGGERVEMQSCGSMIGRRKKTRDLWGEVRARSGGAPCLTYATEMDQIGDF
jgi:hypothetical protein